MTVSPWQKASQRLDPTHPGPSAWAPRPSSCSHQSHFKLTSICSEDGPRWYCDLPKTLHGLQYLQSIDTFTQNFGDLRRILLARYQTWDEHPDHTGPWKVGGYLSLNYSRPGYKAPKPFNLSLTISWPNLRSRKPNRSSVCSKHRRPTRRVVLLRDREQVS